MKPKKGSWIVKARCVVIKEIVCDDCTEEEARANPYNNFTQESELDTEDCTVLDILPNE